MPSRLAPAVILLAATASAQSFSWRRAELDRMGPCRLVFDSTHERVLSYGSMLTEWTGDRWVVRPTPTQPAAATSFQLAFDAGRDRVVMLLFRDGPAINELWEFDGDDWRRRIFTGPAPVPRAVTAMAYDPSAQQVVIFGGRTQPVSFLNDTWGWNGSVWTQLAATGPSGRAGAAMALHPPSGRMVLYGGNTGSGETWTWNGTIWALANPATSPPAMTTPTMATDIATGNVVVHDGLTASTWTWDGTTWSAVSSAATPPARTDLGMAADGTGGVLLAGGTLVLGASAGIPLTAPAGDVWSLQGSTWSRRRDGGPSPQGYSALTHDHTRNRTVALDGTSPVNLVTWEWDGRRWHDTGKTRPAMSRFSMCFDPYTGRTMVFGGLELGGSFFFRAVPDLMAWDGANWTTVATASSPPGRWNAAMAFDPLHGEIVVHGGTALNVQQSDTWCWTGVGWRLAATAGPSPRALHAMAYDAATGSMLMFGGTNGTAPLGDTWSWNGVTWSALSPTNFPSPRAGHVLHSSIAVPTPVLIGGQGQADRWQWTGSDWQQLPQGLPVTAANLPTLTITTMDGDGNTVFVDQNSTWLGGANVAAISVHGPGCPGGLSAQLEALGEPALGDPGFAVRLRTAPPSAPFVLGLGAGVGSTPIGNCLVYLPAIDHAVFGVTSAAAAAKIALPVPALQSLLGVQFSIQAAILDPTSQLGFALSDGLVGLLGR